MMDNESSIKVDYDMDIEGQRCHVECEAIEMNKKRNRYILICDCFANVPDKELLNEYIQNDGIMKEVIVSRNQEECVICKDEEIDTKVGYINVNEGI
ncbi:hypothetical protein Trydic_g11143 [Trypoxylus dichotomus]